MQTYNTNRQVADSAGTATALFSGVKTGIGVIGVDASVHRNACDAAAVERGSLQGMAHWAVEAGKEVGELVSRSVRSVVSSCQLRACLFLQAW